MAKTFDRPIIIQRIDEESETWVDLYKLHASVNKAKSDNEYLGSGAIQSKVSLTFEIRFFNALKDVCNNTQSYRILFENTPYNIVDYDDYMLRHKTVKLLGESY